MKKRIGIDLDDILLDFNGAFIDFHNEKYGTSHRKKDVTSFYLEEVWGLTKEEALKRLDDFYRSSHHINAEPIAGAIEAVALLAKDNELFIVSSSPEEMRENITKWLEKNFGNKFESIHFTKQNVFDTSRKKSEFCEELGINLFVDDALHNAENIASGGIPVYLLDTPWNQGIIPPLVTRVYSWVEVVEKINEKN